METKNRDSKILNVMIIAITLALVVIITDNIAETLSGSASERANYEKRKKYYEEVILPAKLDLYPARHYIRIDQ
ncbi:hypothetical protein ACFL2A_05580 [Thermodesulfobacteriota bacterium]